ncbi:MAG: cupin domain-containing protein [Gammaproteobacteria bacterium]
MRRDLHQGQGNRATAAHRLQRHLILEGRGRVQIGDAPPEDIRPGSVVFIAPDTSRRITNTGNDDLVFLAISTPRFGPHAYRQI